MTETDDYRGLGWEHGTLCLQRQGAMLAPVTFVLTDGRQVNPMHIAPWGGLSGLDEHPPVLQRLRGEWPCVPFGLSSSAEGVAPGWRHLSAEKEPDDLLHGYSSNTRWSWSVCTQSSLSMSLDYPATSPIASVKRIVTPDKNGPAIDIEFQIYVRRPCRLPIGLHPTFQLASEPGSLVLDPGPFAVGRTHPRSVDASSVFAIDETFSSLREVPVRDGGAIDASRLPFEFATEELLLMSGVQGKAALANQKDGYRVNLSWQKEHFPSLMLWISSRERDMSSWRGKHFALGVEPICSAFALGTGISASENPIANSGFATSRNFEANEIFSTRYRIEAELLE